MPVFSQRGLKFSPNKLLSSYPPVGYYILLGLHPRESRTERGPQLVTGLLPFNCGGNPVHISASDQHSCVVTDAGDLFSWGACDEEGGALGHSHERWQPVAKRVPLLKKVRCLVFFGPRPFAMAVSCNHQ